MTRSHEVPRGRTKSSEVARGRARSHEVARGRMRSNEIDRGRMRSNEVERGRARSSEVEWGRTRSHEDAKRVTHTDPPKCSKIDPNGPDRHQPRAASQAGDSNGPKTKKREQFFRQSPGGPDGVERRRAS